MIDADLRELSARPIDHSLETLESDVWAGLAISVSRRTVAIRQLSFQGAVMALSLIVSIATGIYAIRATGASRSHTLLPSGLELAPSTLLLGNSR